MATTAPTPGATRKDTWHGDPNDLHVIGVDGDDSTHPFFLEEQKQRALAAQDDEAWLTCLASTGPQTAVKMYRLEKDRATRPMGPRFVLTGSRRTMGTRRLNERREERGLEPFTIPYEMFEGTDKEAYAVYIGENEAREPDSMEIRALKAQRFMLPKDQGGFFGGTLKECAEHMKCSTTQITQNLLPILNAETPVREAARAGKIPENMVSVLAREPPETQIAELPKLIAEHAAGSVTVKDVARRISNKARVASGKEEISAIPGRRIWAKLVAMVDSEEIAISAPAARGKPEVKGIDHAVVTMARYLAGQGSMRSIPGLTQALRAAGFEADK